MICATIASLVVALSANTTKFARDMVGAEKNVGRFRGMVNKASGALGGFRGALGMIGIGVGVHALVGQFNQIRETLDKAAKSARLLGIEVGQLRGLEFAADITGLGGERVAPALKTFAKRIGEANRGGGAAGPALEELGIAAEDLIGLRLDEQLGLIADEYVKIESPARQAAIAANLFSKANVDMGLLLAEGREGVEALVAQYERWHGTVGDSTTSIEEFNDSMTRLKVLFGGKLERDVVAIAKALNLVAEAADSVGLHGDGAGGFLGQVLSSSGIGLAVLYGEKLGILSTETDAAAEASQQHRTALQQEMAALADVADAATELIEHTDELARSKQSALSGLTDFGQSLKDQLAVLGGTDPLDLQLGAVLNEAKPLMELGEFIEYRDELEELVLQLKAARKAQEEHSKAAAEASQKARELAARQRMLESAAMGYLSSLGVREPVLIGGAAKGSAAAYESMARAQARGGDKSPEEKIRIAVEKALEEDRRQTQTLEAIREELTKTKIAQVPP